MKDFVKSHIPLLIKFHILLGFSLFLISVATLWALTKGECLEIKSKQIEIKASCNKNPKQ